MISLTLENFRRTLKDANLIPVFKEINLDYDNPLSILKKINKNRHCFLLESSNGPEKWSQFSFIGFNPKMIIKSYGNRIETILDTGKKTTSGKVQHFIQGVNLLLKTEENEPKVKILNIIQKFTKRI